MAGTVEITAMRRALALAALGPAHGPNPRVGCVLLGEHGEVLGEGFHRGAGTPHAEVAALADAARRGAEVRGATAVVTLEPCDHTGRTGPCSQALLDAGIARVVHADTDPNPVAAGGATRMRAAGVDVEAGPLATEARALNRYWAFAVAAGRPFVTWKFATTLDGRSAAADGSSRWITGDAARADVHARRAGADAVLVGTGTILADDPALTVRDADGRPATRQPLRAVLGERDVPGTAQVRDGVAELVVLAHRDPAKALATLADREVRHVWLEGGPTVAAAFWRAGLVDEVLAYVAPVLLGAGRPAVGDLGVTTIGDAARLVTVDTRRFGDDVLLVCAPAPIEPIEPIEPTQPTRPTEPGGQVASTTKTVTE